MPIFHSYISSNYSDSWRVSSTRVVHAAAWFSSLQVLGSWALCVSLPHLLTSPGHPHHTRSVVPVAEKVSRIL